MVAHFVFMAALPFVFLTHEGRKAIGLRLPSRRGWLLWGPLLGALAAIVIGLIGLLLFDWSPDNWYVSFGQTMLRDHRLAGLPPVTLALTLGIPAAVFSPVGEELFFRGLLHTAIENVVDGHGRTPLALAVRACVDSHWTHRRSPETTAALLRAGARVDGIKFPSGYREVDELLEPHTKTG